MSTNPYQSPNSIQEAVGVNGGRREDLKSIAQYQRGIMFCILGNVVLMVVNALNRPVGGSPGVLSVVLLAAFIGIGLAQLALIVMLSFKVYNTAVGVLAGLTSFVPCVGLIVLLIVNQKATSVLQANGIKVGLLGANMSQFP